MTIAPFLLGAVALLVGPAVTILIVMTVFKHAAVESKRRHEAFAAALEKGVYDPNLLGRQAGTGGTAALGWGFFFIAVGLALFVGFISLGILSDALIGSLVPLFMGIALVLYYRIRKSMASGADANGKPIEISKRDASRPGGTI
jgi:hypothetical protein